MRYQNELQLQYKFETGGNPESEIYDSYDFEDGKGDDLSLEVYPPKYVHWLEEKLLSKLKQS